MSQGEVNLSLDQKTILDLEAIGFTSNEARLYMACLHLGRGTVSQITKLAGINRTTGYDVLNTLAIKGLVSVSGKEPKQEYVAESPDKISSYLESRIKSQEMNLKSAEAMIPSLKSVHRVGDRPTVKFYEGEEGLRQVYEDTLTSSETIKAYASVGDTNTGLPNYFPKYYKRRAAKGIGIRAIFPHDEAADERSKLDKLEKRVSLHVDKEKYSFSPEINFYDNKVMIASWKEKLGITIESREIADAFKKIFELAWLEAERQDKKLRKK